MTALRLENIQKSYAGKRVLHAVSFDVPEGEVVGLLGPNGAGKTTLLKLIAGLSAPDQGHVEIFGVDARRNRKRLSAAVGLVPQENTLERELTVREALELYAKLYGVKAPKERVAGLIAEFQMESWQDSGIDHLSGGMARRALIARALLPNPRLLLLDEPSVGLDPDVRQEIWQVIRRLKTKGKTVVITTHYMDEAEALCDRVALLRGGRLLCVDTADGLKRRADLIGPGRENATLEAAFLRLIQRESA